MVPQPPTPVVKLVMPKPVVTEAQREAATEHLAQAVESAAEHPTPFGLGRSPVGIPRQFVTLFVKENGDRFLVIDYRSLEAPAVQGAINGTWFQAHHLTHIEVVPEQEPPPGGWRDF